MEIWTFHLRGGKLNNPSTEPTPPGALLPYMVGEAGRPPRREQGGGGHRWGRHAGSPERWPPRPGRRPRGTPPALRDWCLLRSVPAMSISENVLHNFSPGSFVACYVPIKISSSFSGICCPPSWLQRHLAMAFPSRRRTDIFQGRPHPRDVATVVSSQRRTDIFRDQRRTDSLNHPRDVPTFWNLGF